MSQRKTYLYQIKPNRSDFLTTMTETEQVVMGEHLAYLQNLLDKGQLLLAGPCEDATFGIAVFYADSEQEARAVMENDPAVREQIMNARLHPFRAAFFAGQSNPQA
ncbi:YciI family protein [Brevibacillus dissolubilis]|uniref:YciI family protein n=1 Tax=Brevibacillus dissolubilis TaxID=1844116 RepID=UPI001116D662|nr:YciI family protein [Brevibacillus dissolubilis]